MIFGIIAVACGLAEEFFACLLATIMHEFFHYYVASMLGMEIGTAKITPFGGMIEIPLEKHTTAENLAVIFAGGVSNLAVAILLCAVWWCFPKAYGMTYLFAKANITIAVVNFLPVFPLDGGRAGYIWCKEVLKMRKAESVISIFGGILGVAFIGLFFIDKRNITLITLGIFMLVGSEKTLREISRFSAISKWQTKNQSKEKSSIAIENVVVASDNTRIYKVFFHFKKNGENILKIRMQNGKTKTLSQSEFRSLIMEKSNKISSQTTLAQLFSA